MAKRRANGEGNIRKRKDGRWEGRYTAGHDPATGKIIYKNVLGKTQDEVRKKLRQALGESEHLDFTTRGKYNVGEWMDIWFEHYALLKVRYSSHQTYQGYIKNHIKPYIGDIPVEKLTSLELQRLYKHLLEEGRVNRLESRNQPKGLTPKTVRNINQMIRSAMEMAKEQRIILYNPAEKCVLPKVEYREMQTLPEEGIACFMEAAKAYNMYEMYYIELVTGLRRGELCGLKWSDVDFKHKTLHVRRQLYRKNGEIVAAPLKTKNSYRNLSLSDEAIRVLKQQKLKTNDQYVFPSQFGGPISPDSMNNTLHHVLDKAGLQRIRFHDLRHTFATIALQNGVDIKTVSSMLGHFSAGFTLDTYAHVTTAAQTEAANTMGGVMANALDPLEAETKVYAIG